MKGIFAKTLLAALAGLLSISAASAAQSAFTTTSAVSDAGGGVHRVHDMADGPWPKDNSKD